MSDTDYYNEVFPKGIEYRLADGSSVYFLDTMRWGNVSAKYNVQCDPIEWVKLEVRYHRENQLYMKLYEIYKEEEDGKIIFNRSSMLHINPFDIVQFKLINDPQDLYEHPDWDWPEETDYYSIN